LRGVVVSHSFPFRASRRLKFSHNSILPCTAFPSTLVSMLELSPPLPILLLPRVGGLSALSTRAIFTFDVYSFLACDVNFSAMKTVASGTLANMCQNIRRDVPENTDTAMRTPDLTQPSTSTLVLNA
jgi:hypothetical protein